MRSMNYHFPSGGCKLVIRPRIEKTSNEDHSNRFGGILTYGGPINLYAKACFFATMPNALRQAPACGKIIIHSAWGLALGGKLPDRSNS
jgi:hypothetical protein